MTISNNTTTDDLFPSDYFKADDIGNRKINLTIKDIVMEMMGDGQQKAVLKFHEVDKGLVVNKTNSKTLQKITGTKICAEWIGAKITLGCLQIDYKGELVWAVRILLPEQEAPVDIAHRRTPEQIVNELGYAPPAPPPAFGE